MKEIRGSLIAKGKKFSIVISGFNELISKELLAGCYDTLKRDGAVDKDIAVFWTPGAFEIPSVAKKISESKKFDAIICLGAIIRGDTPHFDYISSSVTRGISNLASSVKVPVIFGIITAESYEHALERAGIKQGNRGREAALAAIEMANLFSQI